MRQLLTALLIVLVFGCIGNDVDRINIFSIAPEYVTFEDRTPSTDVYGEDTITEYSQSDSGYLLPQPSPIYDTTQKGFIPINGIGIIGVATKGSGFYLDTTNGGWWITAVGKDTTPKPSHLPDTIKKFYDTAGMPIMIIDGRETCYLYCLGENQKLALYYYCMATAPKPAPLPDTTKPRDTVIFLMNKTKVDWTAATGIGGSIDFMSTTSMNKDSIRKLWSDAAKSTRPIEFTITPVQDTSRCLLLVSDTSSQNGFRSSRCWWMEGWVVKELRNSYYGGNGISVDPNFPYAVNSDILKYNYWQPTEFLDETRHPLKKNFIVWLSKEIK